MINSGVHNLFFAPDDRGSGSASHDAATQPARQAPQESSKSSLYQNEPALSRLEQATFEEVRTRLAFPPGGSLALISTIWGTPSFTGLQSRAAFRPEKGEFRGTVTDGNDRMPYVGFWLSQPGINSTILLQNSEVAIDPSLVDWFRRAGIGDDVVIVKDAAEMKSYLQQRNSKVYGCDNYGPELEPYSVNSAHDFDSVSLKSWVTRLVGKYAPYEEVIDMFRTPINGDLLDRVMGTSKCVYVKLCNDEHGGMGVKPVRNLGELEAVVQAHREHTAAHGLSHDLVLQRGIEGVSRSFCIFVDPRSQNIPILAVTDQVVDPITGRDLGNRHYPLTRDVIDPLADMILTLRNNIGQYFPKAYGLVMCDFIESRQGDKIEYYAIDPGLRPSASTPSAMAQLWVAKHTGVFPYVRNNLNFKFEPGTDYESFCARIGDLGDPDKIKTTGLGVVPFSWEPKYGTGRTITIAPDEQSHDRMIAQLQRTLGQHIV